MTIPLVLVSSKTKLLQKYEQEVARDQLPRLDYIELARELGGDYSGYDLFKAPWYGRMLQLEKRLKLDMLESFFAWTCSRKYNLFLSTSEKAAIPLSILLLAARKKKPHVLIGHRLSSGNKQRLFRLWKLQKTLDHIICVSRTQADYVVKELDYPADKVDFVYDKVDQRFYSPNGQAPEDYILAVGQEQRDYETLLQAIAGTGIHLVLVASSPWSTFSVQVGDLENVTQRSHISFKQLRSLYAGAKLVVVPLHDVDYAAGANAVLEAMAMAKPLILSRSHGIGDYVVDRETGVFVSPGDPKELKETILHTLNHPKEMKRLGANARQVVEEKMNIDRYVEQVVRITRNLLDRSEGANQAIQETRRPVHAEGND